MQTPEYISFIEDKNNFSFVDFNSISNAKFDMNKEISNSEVAGKDPIMIEFAKIPREWLEQDKKSSRRRAGADYDKIENVIKRYKEYLKKTGQDLTQEEWKEYNSIPKDWLEREKSKFRMGDSTPRKILERWRKHLLDLAEQKKRASNSTSEAAGSNNIFIGIALIVIIVIAYFLFKKE